MKTSSWKLPGVLEGGGGGGIRWEQSGQGFDKAWGASWGGGLEGAGEAPGDSGGAGRAVPRNPSSEDGVQGSPGLSPPRLSFPCGPAVLGIHSFPAAGGGCPPPSLPSQRPAGAPPPPPRALLPACLPVTLRVTSHFPCGDHQGRRLAQSLNCTLNLSIIPGDLIINPSQ